MQLPIPELMQQGTIDKGRTAAVGHRRHARCCAHTFIYFCSRVQLLTFFFYLYNNLAYYTMVSLVPLSFLFSVHNLGIPSLTEEAAQPVVSLPLIRIGPQPPD